MVTNAVYIGSIAVYGSLTSLLFVFFLREVDPIYPTDSDLPVVIKSLLWRLSDMLDVFITPT